MKKCICLLMVLVGFLSIPWNSSYAASNSVHRNCAVIIGDTDFKTRHYMAYLDKFFTEYDVESGVGMQELYSNYWLEKGELKDGELNKEVMLDFARYSGYDKVLFLVIDNSVTEKTKTYDWVWGGDIEHTRSNIEIKAILVDSDKIIKAATEIQEDTSSTSELRAKRGAFKQCIEKLTPKFAPYMK